MVTIDAQVLVPETACRCGGRYTVVKYKKDGIARLMHNKPPCPQYEQLKGPAFFEWVRTGKMPVVPTKLNRRAQRQQKRIERGLHVGGTRRTR